MSFALLGFLGCQPLDSGATLGEPFTGETDGTGAALENPALELGDGRTTNTGCEAVELQAFDILERTCARCHGGDTAGARQGTPPFDCVLEPERMVSMVSATAKDPEGLQPARILVPGDAAHSRLYLRSLHGEMPPPDVIGLPANPRPSVSDLSVLRHWIDSCMPTSDRGVGVDEHDTSAPDDHSSTH
jgi:hypothetical protein